MRIVDFAVVLAVACALAALPGIAVAGLYKCELDNGITYQQTPCPPGRELRDFDRNPATVSVVPFRVVPENEPRGNAHDAVSRPSGQAKPADAKQANAKPVKAKPGKARPATAESTDAGGSGGKAAERKFLIPGIYVGEVLARVGNPDRESGNRSKTMRWTYLPAPDDPSTVTTLTFQEGRLIEVERKVVHAR